jgi:hypothetical protein
VVTGMWLQEFLPIGLVDYNIIYSIYSYLLKNSNCCVFYVVYYVVCI